MKILLISLILLVSLPANAEPFFEQQDKQGHMVLSAVGVSMFAMMGDDPKTAFWSMMAIGLAKEIADGNNNTMEEHAADLLADAIGASHIFMWRYEF